MTKITMIQGTSRNVKLTFFESDGTTPFDLTGGKVYLTVNADNTPDDDTSAAFQKTVTSHTDPTNGKTTVAILPADTSGVSSGTYHYDAKAIATSGTEVSLPQDKFVLSPAITRSIT